MEKILVIQTAFIGDAVLTLPMIEKLKEMNNSSIIDVLSNPSTSEIFSSSPSVNEVLLLEKRGRHKSLKELISFARDIKKRNYIRIYSPHRSLRTAVIVMIAGVKETYGFSNSSLKHVYKNIIKYYPRVHEVQRNLDLIGFNYSENNWKIIPQINVHESGKVKVNDYFEDNKIKNGFVAISPGSVWATKRYPIEFIIEVVSILVNNGKQVILIGGENDQEITFKIKENFSENVFDSAGLFSLVESIELLKFASLLITNDSAPTHLGMCADIKVLTLYCSTIPDFGFFPYNNLSGYLSLDDLYCKPCGIHGYDKCPIKTFECGKRLTPDLVIKKIKNMIV